MREECARQRVQMVIWGGKITHSINDLFMCVLMFREYFNVLQYLMYFIGVSVAKRKHEVEQELIF